MKNINYYTTSQKFHHINKNLFFSKHFKRISKTREEIFTFMLELFNVQLLINRNPLTHTHNLYVHALKKLHLNNSPKLSGKQASEQEKTKKFLS